MLSWVGKHPLREVRAFPAQLVERFGADASVNPGVDWSDWPDRYERGGLLFHGDNKEVLAHLLANGFRGKVDLVYIDPPFDSGADYVRRVQLRGASGTARLDGETYTLGEQIQYTDIWANDTYLQFMYERLLLLKELMSEKGMCMVHLDEGRVHYLKVMLDELFGPDRFINEIVWKRQTAHSDVGQGARHLGRLHDSLLIYSKGNDFTWNELFTPYTDAYTDAFYKHIEAKTGRRYRLSDATAPGGSGKGNPHYEFLGVTRYWRFSQKRMQELYELGRIIQTSPGAVPAQKRYLDEMRGVPLQSIWDDIRPIQSQAGERADFPTQKPEALLERIISLGSQVGDVVLDCFIGSGTTAAVAQKLGRRWIGADINKGAIQTTVKRLAGVTEKQAAASVHAQQRAFEGTDDDAAPPPPAQLAFTTWRVNDYDLAIQHNEAVNLACEHLGVERTKTDPFFDGTLGKKLVKIVAFNHPATVLDLQDAARELESRPGEERDAVLVALGQEMRATDWLEDHNRHRPINRLEVIELRSDPRYGRFFEHRPASARVRLEVGQPDPDAHRLDGPIPGRVIIDDFMSPSILERLSGTDGVLAPQVTDWRSMVDSVMIDVAYDGSVFNIALADIPERKADLVAGAYDVDLPRDTLHAPVAVKISDMLGEEVLVLLARG
ncbi:MAG: site-specific DNA-methyltransferase [Candidatus Limnocylindria bacterium]